MKAKTTIVSLISCISIGSFFKVVSSDLCLKKENLCILVIASHTLLKINYTTLSTLSLTVNSAASETLEKLISGRD